MLRTKRARASAVIGAMFAANAMFYFVKEGVTVEAFAFALGIPVVWTVLFFGVMYASKWVQRGEN